MIKMNFGNNNPFGDIYREMLGKIYHQYLYHSGKKEYQLRNALMYGTLPLFPSGSYLGNESIDSILDQDSCEALDKIKNTALSIAYRIKMHGDIDLQLDYNWSFVKNEINELDFYFPGKDRGSERRRSTLCSELMKIYKNRLDEKVTCWKDLLEPMRYFIHLFHQYRRLKQDKKLLEE